MRSIPSGVFGPVLNPPWSRHRPFGIAGHWQSVPRRFFAPHRAALVKSPGGLPLFSRPRRFSWGVCSGIAIAPLPSPGCAHRPHNRLPALMDMDVLHRYLLLTGQALQFLPGFNLLQVEVH